MFGFKFKNIKDKLWSTKRFLEIQNEIVITGAHAPLTTSKMTFLAHHDHLEFLDMSFSLVNALTTFQSLMNTMLCSFLCQFVLMLSDDILIYSSS